MIVYELIKETDAEKFWRFLNRLDRETDCMMYEPEEREKTTDLQSLREELKDAGNRKDFLMAAKENGELAGYIRAEKGRFARTAHTAYIVVGILKEYRGRGIGTHFFEDLDQWAEKERIVRLELTVECRNEAAVHLYEKSGFKVEGVRERSMLVNGKYVDEYYMAKVLHGFGDVCVS